MILITNCLENALNNLLLSREKILKKVIKILIGTVYNEYSSFKLIN